MRPLLVIVEGKRDRERLLPIVGNHAEIVCTYGVPTHARLMEIKSRSAGAEIVIFTDHDQAGRRIRGLLREEFPDATHLHTKSEYGAVERTPAAYLEEQFAKHDLLPQDGPTPFKEPDSPAPRPPQSSREWK